MPSIRLSFVGDDFTGSTDALESLARAGLRTRLFTSLPTEATLRRYPDLEAFGVAGTSRAMTPAQMEQNLWPIFESLRQLGTPIVHYKVCSTFDSSAHIGSIGKVIEIGMDVFKSRPLPLLVGAPSLGRYCVFGNLFARLGAGGGIFRLDRHPSISRHPITPMQEADLRLHLAKQTGKSIGLIDVLQLDQIQSLDVDADVVLIDVLHDSQLAKIGRLLQEHAGRHAPMFIVGSSGVEAALAAHWSLPSRRFESPGDAGPIVAVCGSCSPVTIEQIRWATANGFSEMTLRSKVRSAIDAIEAGRNIVLHTNAAVRVKDPHEFGEKLGRMLREILEATDVRRVIVAGGDTAGDVARVLAIESMEMIAELTRGSPLCRVTAPGSPADGIEMTFKGGQIGPVDFFGRVQRGICV